jgi:hypothetical protein
MRSPGQNVFRPVEFDRPVDEPAQSSGTRIIGVQPDPV